MSNIPIHASGTGAGGEMTMCGMAFDAHDSGDSDEPIIFAKSRQRITCDDCRRCIDHARKFVGYIEP